MVGIDLNAEQTPVDRHGGIGGRLGVEAAIEELPAGGECLLEITDYQRDDRRVAAVVLDAEGIETARKPLDPGMKPAEELVVFRRHHDVADS